MDDATKMEINRLCTEANAGDRSTFFFSEEGTLAKWESNVRRMYCIRKHGDMAFEHFVPEQLVIRETISLIDRASRYGVNVGYNEGARFVKKAMRDLLGIEEKRGA